MEETGLLDDVIADISGAERVVGPRRVEEEAINARGADDHSI